MGHSYTCLKYHIIFATKYRMPLIPAKHEAALHAHIGGILWNRKGRMLEINGTEDHIHILASFPAARSVASIVAAIKANSSSYGKELMGNVDFFWQSGYAAFAVSESQILRVRRYIRSQKEHHGIKSYDVEIRELFQRHGIEGATSFLKAEPTEEEQTKEDFRSPEGGNT
jgi:REP element-mobilizing transposase RayT